MGWRSRRFGVLSVLIVAGCSMTPSLPPSPPLSPTELAWEEAGRPGVHHRLLSPLVGEWRTTSTVWSEPGAKAEISEGQADIRWVLGDRYLEQRYRGSSMGKAVEGVGYIGYDNVLKRYNSVWIDSLGTGMYVEKGAVDRSGKVFDYAGQYADPFTGKLKNGRSTIRLVSDRQFLVQMFDRTPDGREFKSVEISYHRR